MPKDRCNEDDLGVFLSEWNRIQNQTTPKIHFQIALWLQKCWERGETRLLLQAFRASGKSTIAGIFTAWLLHRDPDLRILVLSAESSLAQKMVRTIRKIIERHPSTKALRPSKPDQWAADSFTIKRKRVSRDPSVLARGLFANITGTRADIIICDDVEVPNTCDTPEKREILRDRLGENDFILTPGGMQLFIGTPHSYFSIYTDKPRKEAGETDIFLKGYKRFFSPIITEEGISAWPERYPLDEIETMRRNAGPMKFASQMMLEPVNITEGRLDPLLLRRYEDALEIKEAQQSVTLKIAGRKIVSGSAFWDPSFGKASGDASVLAVVFTDSEGDYWLHHMEYIRVRAGDDEDEATLQCQKIVELARDLFIPVIGVETNGLGKFLPAILRKELAKAKIACTVQERHSTQNKEQRILEKFDVVMAARSLHVHASVYKTPFISEMNEWRPSIRNRHDDGLDAVAGALDMEPLRIRRYYHTGAKRWSAHGTAHTAKTDFDV